MSRNEDFVKQGCDIRDIRGNCEKTECNGSYVEFRILSLVETKLDFKIFSSS